MIENILEIWSRRKWWLSGGFLLAVVTSACLIFALPNIYRGSTTVLLGQDAIAGSFVNSGASSQLDQRLHVIRQELLSRARLLALIERFDLYDGLRQTVPAGALLARMRQDISISQTTTSQASLQRGQPAPMEVRISYQGWSPTEVADVANALADVYREEYEGIRFGQALRTTEFLQQQLEDVERRMHAQEQEINAFRARNLGQLPEQENMNLATLDRLNSDLRLNGERQVQLLSRRNEPTGAGFSALPGVAGESRLDALQNELLVMRARYNDSHPGMIRLQDEIQAVKESLRLAAEQAPAPDAGRGATPESGFAAPAINTFDEIRRLRIEEANLRDAIASIHKRLQLAPEIDQALTQMTNSYATIREEHLALQRRYQDARLAQSLESQQTQQFQILELALPPDFASGPNRMRLMIMALMITIAVLGGLVFLAEQLDQSFHGTDDLKTFSSVPVLASIRRMETKPERAKRGMAALLILVLFVGIVAGLGSLAYSKGQTAKGIVWMVVGNNA